VAVIGARNGDRMTGHFGSGATFVAAATKAFAALREGR
jgi:hypothetical protein